MTLPIKRLPELQSITPGDIEAFETYTQLTLPEDYKHFLLHYNGGSVSAKTTIQKFGVVYLGWFCGLHLSENLDLKTYFNIFKNTGRIPDGFIKIGSANGDSILLSLDKNTFGQVFLLDHENENTEIEHQSLADFENIYLIAGSFDAFIAMLEEDE